MDANRFDRFARSLAAHRPRRTLVAAGLGAVLAAVGLREGALACKKNGEECDQDKADKCCSGTCQKKGGKSKCVKAKGAFGCTNQKKFDACAGNEVPCPNNPDGQCIVDEKKRPFCFREGECVNCQNDEDCTELAGGVKGRCIKKCGECSQTGGRACVFAPGAIQP